MRGFRLLVTIAALAALLPSPSPAGPAPTITAGPLINPGSFSYVGQPPFGGFCTGSDYLNPINTTVVEFRVGTMDMSGSFSVASRCGTFRLSFSAGQCVFRSNGISCTQNGPGSRRADVFTFNGVSFRSISAEEFFSTSSFWSVSGTTLAVT